MREAKTPQHKVAGLEWYTQADLNRQPSESESDALSSCAMGAYGHAVSDCHAFYELYHTNLQ